jgi:regulator of RNase E activity RraA
LTTARDLALVDRLDRLRAAVVADALDRVGVRENVLAPHIRPLYSDATVAGFAATVHCVEVDAVPANRGDWYKGELEAVDAVRPGDVMVASSCQGCFWGELLATASRARGARGIVADAYARDTAALIEMRFPTFVAGVSPVDSLGRIDVDEVGVPVECGGVTVHPGDLVMGDHDGVVIVPRSVASEVLAIAEEKSAGEDVVRDELARGMPVSEAFRKYGVI